MVIVVVVVVVVFNTQAFGGIQCTFYHPIIIIHMYYGKFYLRFTVSCGFVGNLLNFIFGHASDLYLCLYSQLFALFHYVFKFLTP